MRTVAESRRRMLVTGAIVAAVGMAHFTLLELTTTSAEGDFFDSPLFWWGWLILPAMAAGGAATAPAGAGWWGWLLVAPQAVSVVIEGAVLHDPQQGASFWPVGLTFVLLLGVVASGAAQLGRAARRPSKGRGDAH